MQNYNLNKRLVETGNYVGLKYDEGWLFVHVLEREYIELKPWVLINENGNRDVIESETAGSEDDEIVNVSENKLVTPADDEQNLIFQVFVGVEPDRMQLFPIFGRDRTPNLEGGAEPGQPQIWLNGFDSPYNNPTEQSEIFTMNNIDTLSLQAFNPMSEPAEARVSFHVNKFKYAVVENKSFMRGFLQGQQPFKDHSMGLASQDREQLSAPEWVKDRFGDVIFETEEIIGKGGESGSSVDDVPAGVSGGG
jgi:hypothetical protein